MRTALIVADSSWVVNQIRTALAVDPWEIVVVSEPRTAADEVVELEPAVVLIDMQVGSMGGMAVARDVRAKTQKGPTPRMVLLLDRSADAFLAKRALVDASVIKPFNATELRDAIDPKPVALAGVGSHGEEE